jgi:tetratricopeptide (TPR) repeat protein
VHRTKELEGGRRAQAAARARALLAQGEPEQAFLAALEGDAFEEAALARARQGCPAEAGRLLLLGLGTSIGDLSRLVGDSREQALLAVGHFVDAGEQRWAAQIRRQLDGAPVPGRGRMELLPLLREVAQLAEVLRRPLEAARVLEAGEAFAEAALLYLAAGERQRSLETLVRIPRDSEQYRPACVRAVALAAETGALSVVLEQFLSRFVSTGPQSPMEMDAFYRLALGYERDGALANAEEALQKLLAIRPDYADAAAVLARVQQRRRGERKHRSESILADEVTFVVRSRRRAAPTAGAPPDDALPTAPLATAPGMALPFGEGSLVAERYRIGRMIGRGGMSLVFEARDTELGEAVALKVFVHPVQSEELVARFKREMQVSRQLQHRNILRLHDMGSAQGYRFVSMELLVGNDLRKFVSSRVALRVALDYLVQVCDGLEAAHTLSVVHRDIKPENLFVTASGVVKVMDFGIAKVMSAPNVTLGGVIWGTPRYMSPEQINSFSSVSPASDLYSLGVVAYELVVGHAPFDHPDLTELLLMHVRQAPLAPRELRVDLPVGLEALILAMLAKRPQERPASASECAGRLRAVLAGLG